MADSSIRKNTKMADSYISKRSKIANSSISKTSKAADCSVGKKRIMADSSIGKRSKAADSTISKKCKIRNSSSRRTSKMADSAESQQVDVAAIKQKLCQFRDRGRKLGLTDEEIYGCFELNASQSQIKLRRFLLKSKLRFIRPIRLLWLRCPRFRVRLVVLFVLAVVVVMVGLGFGAHTYMADVIFHTECLIESNAFINEMLRPRLSCTFCQNLTDVPEYDDISEDAFTRQHGYNGVPVLVKGACRNWTAIGTFSYQYFKEVYTRRPDTLEDIQSECQFFSYDSDLSSLGELFAISDDRAAYKDGEDRWYVGWVNCDPEIADELITHYQRPHFLPSDSYNDYKIWIFMGWPGYGAGTHIDFVQLPSWQAQVAGTKTWELIPSPECEHICHSLSVTVEAGDIFVVDTNIWYHSTFIHSGNMSITIGSEYD